MNPQWRGVFAIPPTPFDPSGGLDETSLRRCIAFCLESGVHGIVAPVNASEFHYLSERERERVTAIVIEETKGRVPVVIGITAACARLAVELARIAEGLGADAVIAMPPHVQKAAPAEIRDYYRAISQATRLPVFLQNYGGPGGTPMSTLLMGELVRSLENVGWVKEESEDSSQMISEVQALLGKRLRGVMGGKAGRHLLDEYRRGACGTMPACEVADLHVRLWNLLEAGRMEEAAQLYEQLLPLLLFEMVHGVAVYKEVLRRRGVIACSDYRQVGGKGLDAPARAALDAILARIAPLLTIAPLER